MQTSAQFTKENAVRPPEAAQPGLVSTLVQPFIRGLFGFLHQRMHIKLLTPAEIEAALPQLVALLQDAVDSGASVGFLPPVAAAAAGQFWRDVAMGVAAGHRVVLVAQDGLAGCILGTGQLVLATNPNALHRAEVAKVIVHRQARRRGIGQQLLQALETEAVLRGRTTLVLDTRHGDPAEQLYQRHGFQFLGAIPEYFLNNDGQLHATAVYYKLLGPAARPQE